MIHLFPYTNFHDLNLDWLLRMIKRFLHISVSAEAGEEADVSYSEEENALHFTLPRGLQGLQGPRGYSGTVVQHDEPTEPWPVLWIDPENMELHIIAEINDEQASGESTYSSLKIESMVNPLRGKKICSFGDSLAAMDDGDRNANTWLKMVCEFFGATGYNRGIGGSCVTNADEDGNSRDGYAYADASGDAGAIRVVYETAQSFVAYPNSISPWMVDDSRVATIPLDTDVVLITAGANDFGSSTFADFYTAYATMLRKIRTRLPYAKIYCFGMPYHQLADGTLDGENNDYETLRETIRQAAEDNGCAYMSLKAEMGVDSTNYSNFMNDTVHYNTPRGRARFASAVVPFLLAHYHADLLPMPQ